MFKRRRVPHGFVESAVGFDINSEEVFPKREGVGCEIPLGLADEQPGDIVQRAKVAHQAQLKGAVEVEQYPDIGIESEAFEGVRKAAEHQISLASP